MTSSSRIQASDLRASLDLIEVKPGKKFSVAVLKDMLPDSETLLFFAKAYTLDYAQLSHLITKVLDSDVVRELTSGSHSTELQDYIVDIVPDVVAGQVTYGVAPPQGEILPQMWEAAEVEIADSIKAVADKLDTIISALPGKKAQMVFKSLMTMNRKRPTLGDFKAQIVHPPSLPNLVILDVSGSMSQETVEKIASEVVALGYAADAHFAIVSNSTFHWEPGSYSVSGVLSQAEYGGTRYETLAPLFNQDWGVVVTIADYDSSYSAAQYISEATGSVQQVLDVSLVNQPTFLAHCVGQLATKVTPLLIGSGYGVLN